MHYTSNVTNATHVRLAFFVYQLLVLEKKLDGFDKFLIYGLQESVACLHAHDDQ